MSIGFQAVKKIVLPKEVAQTAIDALYAAGNKNCEGVALFAGQRVDETFIIRKAIIPNHESGAVENGLLYVVQGDELHRINVELFDSGMRLIAQIHSHPGIAYHSETDDAFPIITTLGGISIVVPNFARGGINLDDWAVYRLSPEKQWVELSNSEKSDLILIVEGDNSFKKTKKRKFWPWQ